MSKNVMAYMIVAILSCCTACSGTGSDVSHDTVKKALTPDLVVIEKEQYFKDDQRLVVVVGENHASVKTQIQLAWL